MESKNAKEIYIAKGHFKDEMVSLTIYCDGSIEVCQYDTYNKTMKANPILDPNGNGFDLHFGVSSLRTTMPFIDKVNGKLCKEWRKVK